MIDYYLNIKKGLRMKKITILLFCLIFIPINLKAPWSQRAPGTCINNEDAKPICIKFCSEQGAWGEQGVMNAYKCENGIPKCSCKI